MGHSGCCWKKVEGQRKRQGDPRSSRDHTPEGWGWLRAECRELSIHLPLLYWLLLRVAQREFAFTLALPFDPIAFYTGKSESSWKSELRRIFWCKAFLKSMQNVFILYISHKLFEGSSYAFISKMWINLSFNSIFQKLLAIHSYFLLNKIHPCQ